MQYPSFKEACIAQGLLENDNKWHQCLEEARDMQTGAQLCHLFVTIIRDCTSADPRALWNTLQNTFWPSIYDDIRHMLQTHANIPEPSNVQIQDYGLYLIDKLLAQIGRRLQQWAGPAGLPQMVNNQSGILGNALILEQQQYNLVKQARLAEECRGNLNLDQQAAFKRITFAIANRIEETFFLHGPKDTDKTYLYNTLCYQLH